MEPRSIDLLVDLAAKERQEYVEERRTEMEEIELGLPHCSLISERELPTNDS